MSRQRSYSEYSEYSEENEDLEELMNLSWLRELRKEEERQKRVSCGQHHTWKRKTNRIERARARATIQRDQRIIIDTSGARLLR